MAKRLIYKGSLDGSAPIYRYFPVNDSQTLHVGDIVVLSSSKISIAADAAGAGTVMGVCNTEIVTTTATAADVVAVDINPMSIYRIGYTGSATPALGAKYDMGGAAYQADSDDTTGGYIQCIGNVNTTTKEFACILCNRVFGMA